MTCKDGYAFIGTTSKLCVACTSTHTKDCSIAKDVAKVCKVGYELMGDSKNCCKVGHHCTTCNGNNDDCLTCTAPNFVLNSTTKKCVA
jgi:hypothetical protein